MTKGKNPAVSGDACATSEVGDTCEEGGCSGDSCSCTALSQQISPQSVFNWRKNLTPFIISLGLVLIAWVFETYTILSRFSIEDTQGYLIILSLYTLSYCISSFSVFRKVFKHLRMKIIFDENFLMMIATIGAIFTQNFVEAIAVMLFYKLGVMIEDFGVFKSRKSITALLESRPEEATIYTKTDLRVIPAKNVQIGERILVKPGEKVPLDGILLSPEGQLDTSALTGESYPRKFRTGQEILSGMVNLSSVIILQVIHTYSNSAIARILDLVSNAEQNKSQTEKFTRQFAKYYTPLVVIAATLLALLPPLIIPNALFTVWAYRAMIFLVISCPCALVISVPLTYFGGIGGASRQGILIKGTQYLEALAKMDTLLFDKTGTLTQGIIRVTKIQTLNGYTEQELLGIVAAAEQYSTHPVAQSIINTYQEITEQDQLSDEMVSYTVENFIELPGYGIQATVDGLQIVVGSDKILHKFAIAHPRRYCQMTGMIVHISINNTHRGYFELSDALKDQTAHVLQELRAIGINRMIMLSGDEWTAAQKIGTELHLDEVYGNLLPEEKVNSLEHIKQQKIQTSGRVGYAGDGINDAPVIARADIGFAMGGFGSDAAIEAADIILMEGDLGKIAKSIRIAQKTRRINWQNIGLIFLVKGLFLLLGVFGLTSMWGAVFADVGMALIAILNSRRMLSYKPLSTNHQNFPKLATTHI